MEQSKKNLKTYSLLVLLFAALSLVRMIVALIAGDLDISTANLPEGTSVELVKAMALIIWALGLVFLLPDVYVGFKGIKEANEPSGSRGHIIWAIILLVISALAAISDIGNLLSGGNIGMDIVALIDSAVSIIVYVLFIKYANEVRASAN